MFVSFIKYMGIHLSMFFDFIYLKVKNKKQIHFASNIRSHSFALEIPSKEFNIGEANEDDSLINENE